MCQRKKETNCWLSIISRGEETKIAFICRWMNDTLIQRAVTNEWWKNSHQKIFCSKKSPEIRMFLTENLQYIKHSKSMALFFPLVAILAWKEIIYLLLNFNYSLVSKGQLISKCTFVSSNLPKNPRNFFQDFSPSL